MVLEQEQRLDFELFVFLVGFVLSFWDDSCST